MNTSGAEVRETLASNVNVTEDAFVVDLVDGRTITASLAWFPRLTHGPPSERAQWRLIAGGQGIHWPNLDEDISVESTGGTRVRRESGVTA